MVLFDVTPYSILIYLQVKDDLISRTANILACYRKNCASPSSAGQLILPELMKLLPLYINCLSKSDAMSGGQDLTCDERSLQMYLLMAMSVDASVVYYYPRLIPLLDDDPQVRGLVRRDSSFCKYFDVVLPC